MRRMTAIDAIAALGACALAAPWWCTSLAEAQQRPREATVEVPLSEWLGERGSAPGALTLGLAEVRVAIEPRGTGEVAVIDASLTLRAAAIGDEALVLPPGVALISASVDGSAATLGARSGGLAWVASSAGEHRMELRYEADLRHGDAGSSVGIPLPRASSVRMHATLPADADDATLVPATGLRLTESGGSVFLEATVPGGMDASVAQLAWSAEGERAPATVSRALYRGELVAGGTDALAARFDVEITVDLATDAPRAVPLFPAHLAIGEVTIDGHEGAVRIEGDRIAALVSGRGRHRVRAVVEIPLASDSGLPSAVLPMIDAPVSRFEIALPDDKDLRVSPAVAATRQRRSGHTVVSFHAPHVDAISLSWPEALPAEAGASEDELRASAELVHVLRAEEGLVRGRVRATYEIARGSASRFELSVPAGVDIDSVSADVASVADWRLGGERGADRTLSVFLDRAVSGVLVLSIEHELLLSAGTDRFEMPLIAAEGARRERGMVALLATRELVLEPEPTTEAARVGENQLPPEVRAEIDATVAHVLRWSDARPTLSAHVAARPREDARFDARIDTLVSLGDATTSATASIDVHVKSGTLAELAIALPAGASVLEVSAPSLREHRVEAEGDHPIVRVLFTQEMEGDLRVVLRWERIAAPNETEVSAPLAHVRGAEVEQGRIAIEATAAVEVAARAAEGLSPLDVAELPEELVLASSSPVLLAFRYTHAAPPPTLALAVARHDEVALRDAAIDSATYRTLVTDDGLAVTTATFVVRNQRQQFLRIALPEGSEMWTARVGGRAQAPAISGEEGTPVILLGVLRSLEPFDVEITYATPISELSMLGRLGLEVARPDVVATRARWEIYLPEGPRWGEASSELALVEAGALVSDVDVGGLASLGEAAGLAVHVPARGVRWVFEDVYVGREGVPVRASFPYASGWGVAIGWVIALLGGLFAWLGLLGLVMARAKIALVPDASAAELATYRFASAAKQVAVGTKGSLGLAAVLALGCALLALAIGWLGTSAWGPIAESALLLVGLLLAMRRPIGARLAAIRARLAPPPLPAAPAPTPVESAPAAE